MNPTTFYFPRMTACLKTLPLLLFLLAGTPAIVQAQFQFVTNNSAITITGYNGADANVVIPATTNGFKVTKIAAFAFNQVDTMTSVTIGTNVTTVGTNAFYQCSSLVAATMPPSVTNFGDGPFYDCQSLTTISTFTNAYYSVTNNYLVNRAHTELIQFPGGVTGSFTVAAAITNVGLGLIGNTLTSIVADPANTFFSSANGVLFNKTKTQLFDYPGGLGGNYVVPTNVIIILSAAFEYSPAIASVTIGTNVTTIGLAAFYDCQSMTSITVNATNAFYLTINGVLFDKKKTMLIQYPAGLAGSYIIPSTVTNVGIGAFGDAFHLTSVVIPDGVTNLDFEAFYACENLASVTIGNHVKTIAADVFFLCTNLSSIIIPASVTSIGADAFGGCFALSSACFQGKPPTDGGSIFFFDNALTSILYVSGNTGWGSTYDGIATAPCTACSGSAPGGPPLSISRSGTNVLIQWPSSYTGYNLEFTTNLSPLSAWKTNLPAAVVVNTQYVATNGISGTRKFYRLIQ